MRSRRSRRSRRPQLFFTPRPRELPPSEVFWWLISAVGESKCRTVVDDCVTWYSRNHLKINDTKTKEPVVDLKESPFAAKYKNQQGSNPHPGLCTTFRTIFTLPLNLTLTLQPNPEGCVCVDWIEWHRCLRVDDNCSHISSSGTERTRPCQKLLLCFNLKQNLILTYFVCFIHKSLHHQNNNHNSVDTNHKLKQNKTLRSVWNTMLGNTALVEQRRWCCRTDRRTGAEMRTSSLSLSLARSHTHTHTYFC